jgi:excisionase family DNA binding protein
MTEFSYALTARPTTESEWAMTAKQAARYLGVCEATLRAWRADGTGPRFFRAGEKLVRYRKADLDEWVASRFDVPPAKPKQVNAETISAPV